MDFEKIKQWMEITQQYQNGKFWEMVFDEEAKESLADEPGMPPAVQKRKQRPGEYPKADIYLTETDIVLLIELPGVLREDISLSVSGTRLSIRGMAQPPLINGMPVRSERRYGEFHRVIDLPEAVGSSQEMMARFENGLLIVSYPRRFSREENVLIR